MAFLDADEIAGLGPEDKKKLLLKKMAERVYLEHEAKVRDKSLKERVSAVADILREEGGFADWKTDGNQYEIVDYNCIYRKVADSHNDLCDWHVSLLGRLLGKQVDCNQFIAQGADSCRFVVSEGAPETSTAAKQ